MLYSQSQVDKMLNREEPEEETEDTIERDTLLMLETEVRKAYHPATEKSFDSKEVEYLLTRLDIIRAENKDKNKDTKTP
jgi:glutathionylspermidine synthase